MYEQEVGCKDTLTCGNGLTRVGRFPDGDANLIACVSLSNGLPDQRLTSSVPMYANNAFAAGFTQLDTAQLSPNYSLNTDKIPTNLEVSPTPTLSSKYDPKGP